MATKATTVDLVEFQRRQLLSDIEKNEARYQKGFKEVCDQNVGFYGEPGTALHTAFLNQLDLYKRQKIRGYLGLLRESGVRPCRKTVKEAKDAGVLKGKLLVFVQSFEQVSSSSSSSMASSDDSSVSSSSSQSSSETGRKESTALPKKTTSSKKSSSSNRPRGVPKQTEEKKNIVLSTPVKDIMEPPTSAFKKLNFGGEDDSGKEQGGSDSTLSSLLNNTVSIGGSRNFYNPDGSTKAPYMYFINSTKPEAHQAFFVLSLPKYSHGDGPKKWIRDIVEIRRSIPPQDVNEWTASIPTYDDGVAFSMDASLNGRVVLVKGPSVDCLNRQPDVLNVRLGEQCDAAADLRAAAMTAIRKKQHREVAHYLFVFPTGTVLDNSAFPGPDNLVLQRKYAGFRETDSVHCPKIDPGDDNSRRETLHGMVVCFQIAMKGGQEVNMAAAEKVDTSALLSP